jgi:hypothetical protein
MSSQARLLLRVPDRKKKTSTPRNDVFTRRHCKALIHYHITSLVWIETICIANYSQPLAKDRAKFV